jgi:hypothetical protein
MHRNLKVMTHAPRGRVIAAVVSAIAVCALSPASALAKAPPRRSACERYDIVGLRGSGEAYAGLYNMGDTAGEAAWYAMNLPGARRARTFSIPYSAPSVKVLLKDPGTYLDALENGEMLLRATVHRIRVRCPQARIAIIGYSSGAAAASEAVRAMSDADRARIAALVLFADPYSSGQSDYSETVPLADSTKPAKRRGTGIFGGRPIPLPAGRVIDWCFSVDLVCNSGGAGTTAFDAFFTSIHSQYKDWDDREMMIISGRFVTRKLQEVPAPPPCSRIPATPC